MNLLSNIKSFIGCFRLKVTILGTQQMAFGALILALSSLSACTDDLDLNADTSSSETSDYYDAEEILSFAINLAEETSSRASSGSVDESWEDYVDINHLQILFFDSDGNFLFEPILNPSQDIVESPDDNNQWIVTIHLTKSMIDCNGAKIPLASVKNALEDGTFKIAALANWKEKIKWGMNESKFNTISCKNVNDLHRLTEESQYKDSCYDFLKEKKSGKMMLGYRVSWVDTKLNYSSDDEDESKRNVAEKLIRKYWNPDLKFTSNEEEVQFLKSHYSGSNLWQVWNFGGSFDINELTYDKIAREENNIENSVSDNTYSEEWQTRNANDLKTWLEDTETVNETPNILKTITDDIVNHGIDGLVFVQADPKAETAGILSTPYNKDGYHGIALGKASNTTKKTFNSYERDYLNFSSDKTPEGYIKIRAYGSGILRVLWKSDLNEKNEGAKLYLQRGSTYEWNSGTVTTDGLQQLYRTIDITADPEELYLFNVNKQGKANIFSIEFICDKYLNVTDNQGRPVSESNLIPMYGIQDFNKIQTWGEGKVLDLSASGDDVNLIRSVAKVEVYFPTSQVPKHIYMRSMNSSSRNEPMDVFNPTLKTWTKFSNPSRNVHDEDHCEFFEIQKHGSLYSNYTHSSHNDNFERWFKYFFGTWDGIIDSPDESTYYPHIFNPMVLRSDFCEFIDCGEVDGMHKYILYMPDKNIDDPNKAGDITETPKVPHIEYRYKRHSDYLDDNSCKRIYFTNYSTNSAIKELSDADYDNFEKNLKPDGETKHNYLDDLWPIMRNHIYRFYINSNNVTEEIRVTVNDWGSQDAKRVPW